MRNGFATIKLSLMLLGAACVVDGTGNGATSHNQIEHQVRKLAYTGKQILDSGARFDLISNKLEAINAGI